MLLDKLLAVDLEFAIANVQPIIAKLHKVNMEVGGAKACAIIAKDLGCLLEVDCMMDGRC
jgi:hypothetical protein